MDQISGDMNYMLKFVENINAGIKGVLKKCKIYY